MNSRNRNPEQNGGYYRNRKCNYCKKIGHLTEECRNRLCIKNNITAAELPSNEDTNGHQVVTATVEASNIKITDAIVTLIQVSGKPRNIPTVKLSSEDLNRDVKMLIVTGMSKSLLKKSALKSLNNIDVTDILNLKSLIGDGETFAQSLGRVEIEILNSQFSFHIVDNDFNIPEDGIISSSFITEKVTIYFGKGTNFLEICGLPFPFINSHDQSHPASSNINNNDDNESLTPYRLDDIEDDHSLPVMEIRGDWICPTFKKTKFSRKQEAEIDRQVVELLARNIIEPSDSPYDWPVMLVPIKKETTMLNRKEKMLVVNYKLLNEQIARDHYQMLKTVEILELMGGAKYFSILVMAYGFYEVHMEKSSVPKTAFTTSRGHFQFKRMSSGLKNGTKVFQRLLDEVLDGLTGVGVFSYLGSIVVYTDSFDRNVEKVKEVIKRLKRAKLNIDYGKCEYAKRRVVYLGHSISKHGIGLDPLKIEKLKNFARPKSVKNVQQFLGLANYYRRFVKDFSKIVKPLTKLSKKGVKFQWTDEQEKAFLELREKLCDDQPILSYPNFEKPFVLSTEASKYSLSGILSQSGPNGENFAISYASRMLVAAEENYSDIEKEILAIVYGVKHFRSYLLENKFTLVTDKKSIEWLNSVQNPKLRLAKWQIKLAEYDYQVVNK